VNAALAVREREAWWPRRDEAYLGVLVDDLITRGVTEPYRMFTSRAEYRLTLREDNADARLTEQGRALGLVEDARWATYSAKREAIERETARLAGITLTPKDEDATALLGAPLLDGARALDLMKRPSVTYAALTALTKVGDASVAAEVAEQVEIAVKYAGYIQRQADDVARSRHREDTLLPADLDYAAVRGLSNEVRQKLSQQRPSTLGEASRISGMTPAAVSVLMVHLKKVDRLRA
jgi:tRNA uridine 5-carboxymethylaminomethyl modification enzyme